MKISNADYITKGILFTVGGALIAFFPQIISGIFYIIGAIIIVSCVLTLLSSFASGDAGFMFGGGIAGILVGILVMSLPKIISVGIPLIAGIILGISGITRCIKAADDSRSKDNRLGNGIVGAVLLIAALFLIFNPFSASTVARVVIGVIMLLFGAFNFYVAHVINERNKNSSPNIIDVDSYSVKDDDQK